MNSLYHDKDLEKKSDSNIINTMKKVKIFGMTIKDYPLKESLNVTRSFLHAPGMQTVSYVSRDILMSVADYPSQKDWLMDLDLLLFAEPIETDRKKLSMTAHDGKKDDYLDMILNNIVASRATIFLLADTDKNLEGIRRMLKQINSRVAFVGEVIYSQDKMEYIFNKINCISPDIIFSCAEWGVQGPLMMDAKRMLGASVWLGFLPSFFEKKSKGIKGWFEERMSQIKFLIKVKKYNK